MSKTAVIIGSSGLVGMELLHQLCAVKEYEAVTLLVRRPSGFSHAKVREHIFDFDRPDAGLLHGDVLFSCLGSTRRKTPDKGRYYQIDHDYPVQIARAAQANGMRQLHLVSAIGANPASRNFYLRMKGETERDTSAIPFNAVHLYRPSFLDGNREEKRGLERAALSLFRLINPLLAGALRKYRSIKAADVARAMIHQSLHGPEGVHVYESDRIQHIADVRGSGV